MQDDTTLSLPLGRKCLPSPNGKAFSWRGEGALACEKGTNTSHRQKFNCVEDGSETLAASGGQLFLNEVFTNFAVRLGNDREGEEGYKGLEDEGEFNLFPNQSGPVSLCGSQDFCSCASLFHLMLPTEKYRLILVPTAAQRFTRALLTQGIDNTSMHLGGKLAHSGQIRCS